MNTTTVDIPSAYARTGKVETAELSIKAELDGSDDVVFLIYGQKRNITERTLIHYTRDLNEAIAKFNDLLLVLLNRQSFQLKQLADSRE